MERQKRRERVRIECEYEKESCLKVVTKWLYEYHFSKKKTHIHTYRICYICFNISIYS